MTTVLVYMRGAIRECYQVGNRFLPVADYHAITFDSFVAVFGFEMSRR